MIKWEYTIKNFYDPLLTTDDYMNNLGEKGWELVNFIQLQNKSFKLIFKRPKVELTTVEENLHKSADC